MNPKEIMEYLWSSKPFWERDSDEEIEYQIKLKQIREHYAKPKVL